MIRLSRTSFIWKWFQIHICYAFIFSSMEISRELEQYRMSMSMSMTPEDENKILKGIESILKPQHRPYLSVFKLGQDLNLTNTIFQSVFNGKNGEIRSVLFNKNLWSSERTITRNRETVERTITKTRKTVELSRELELCRRCGYCFQTFESILSYPCAYYLSKRSFDL